MALLIDAIILFAIFAWVVISGLPPAVRACGAVLGGVIFVLHLLGLSPMGIVIAIIAMAVFAIAVGIGFAIDKKRENRYYDGEEFDIDSYHRDHESVDKHPEVEMHWDD
jgi:hypothetical protein